MSNTCIGDNDRRATALLGCHVDWEFPKGSHEQKEAIMYHKFSTLRHPSDVLSLFPAGWLVCFICFTFLLCVLGSSWSCFWGKLLLCKRRSQTEQHGNLAAIPSNIWFMKSCELPVERNRKHRQARHVQTSIPWAPEEGVPPSQAEAAEVCGKDLSFTFEKACFSLSYQWLGNMSFIILSLFVIFWYIFNISCVSINFWQSLESLHESMHSRGLRSCLPSMPSTEAAPKFKIQTCTAWKPRMDVSHWDIRKDIYSSMESLPFVVVVVAGTSKDWGPENKLSEPIFEFAWCSLGASTEFSTVLEKKFGVDISLHLLLADLLPKLGTGWPSTISNQVGDQQ